MNLRNFFKSYYSEDIYPFHMPGHKRNNKLLSMGENVLRLDITEIPGADNLHEPSGPLRELKSGLAMLYGADESFLLVNGSSSGIIAAIMTVCDNGDNVIVGRNSHKSVFSGLIMSGAKPVYVNPKISADGFCLGLEASDIERVSAAKHIKAVIVTSPTYEGVCSNIKEIARAVHDMGAVLIVDEAHGAHFGFHDYFPQSSVKLGADIVIHSLHKTMPVLTQTAVIHIKTSSIDRDRLAETLAMNQSSSPSYILMSAAELFVDKFIGNSQKYFDNFVELLYPLRKELKCARSLKLIELGDIYDKSKLLMLTGAEYDGGFLSGILKTRFGIEIEMSGKGHILAMTSVADTKDGFDKLIHAVRTMDAEHKPYTKPIYAEEFIFKCVNVMSPREAFQSKRDEIDYKCASGKVASGFVIPYPPGVPIIAPGELITPEVIEIITGCLKRGLTVSGVGDGKLKVINE